MSYESKMIVVQRNEYDGRVYGEEVMRFDLSSVGYGLVNGRYFTEIFKTEIDFNLYNMQEENYDHCGTDEYNEKHRIDCYGKHCKYAEIDEVMDYIASSPELMGYRRTKTFYGMLMMLKANRENWGHLVVVHYGY